MEAKVKFHDFEAKPRPAPRGGATARVADALREAIGSLQFAPGTLLDKQALCDRFGVSRFPVSEALTRLQAEGLVDIQPQRGTTVALIRLADARENMFIRRALESEAMRQLASTITPAQSEQIGRNLRYQKAALEAGDGAGFHSLDLEFHDILLTAVGFARVKAAVESARTGLERVRRLVASPQRHAQTMAEHKRIAAALIARDGDKAAAAMAAHLDAVMAQLLPLAARKPELFADRLEEAR